MTKYREIIRLAQPLLQLSQAKAIEIAYGKNYSRYIKEYRERYKENDRF